MKTTERFDLGIVGGGQLARMTIERASKLGLSTVVLDPDPECPAAGVADAHVGAAFDDPDGLRALVERSRVTTFDLESPDARVLARLERNGHRIFPSPTVLATIQDKFRQREFFAARGFPVPRFFRADAPTPADARQLGFPVVQKARRGGYDGRGVAILRDADDVRDLLPVPSLFEECVPIACEVAILVARGRDGETRAYPAVEMMFDPRLNLIDGLLFPARLDPATAAEAEDLATRAVQALEGVGMFAVELFVGPTGALWLNEIAPRPHNSGHVTIEAAVTCQFEQHVRAVTGMPLGDTSLVRPAAMVNLTGPAGAEGPPELPGLAAALAVPGARLHLYGKNRVRPGRKMGHVTVLDDDPVAALDRARLARRRLALRARNAA
jgi:5-(carboxyamino)imidazole ribonucleotide synthase